MRCSKRVEEVLIADGTVPLHRVGHADVIVLQLHGVASAASARKHRDVVTSASADTGSVNQGQAMLCAECTPAGGHARVAVKKVLTASNAANAAFLAVELLLAEVVVVEVAYRAEVLAKAMACGCRCSAVSHSHIHQEQLP